MEGVTISGPIHPRRWMNINNIQPAIMFQNQISVGQLETELLAEIKELEWT